MSIALQSLSRYERTYDYFLPLRSGIHVWNRRLDLMLYHLDGSFFSLSQSDFPKSCLLSPRTDQTTQKRSIL